MVLELVFLMAQALPAAQPAVAPSDPPALVTTAELSLPAAPSSTKPSGPVMLTAPAEPIVPIQPLRPVPKLRMAPAASRRTWLGLSVALHSAAAFDAWTTRRRVSTGCYYETNPLLKPFADNNSMYLATQVMPFALDYLGNCLRKSDRPWMRRLWWVPQALQTATHVSYGAMNLTK